MAASVPRVSPKEARDHLKAQPGVLLVCAYDDPKKFQQYRLEGAISLDEFQSRADALPRDREIIFYCA